MSNHTLDACAPASTTGQTLRYSRTRWRRIRQPATYGCGWQGGSSEFESRPPARGIAIPPVARPRNWRKF